MDTSATLGRLGFTACRWDYRTVHAIARKEMV